MKLPPNVLSLAKFVAGAWLVVLWFVAATKAGELISGNWPITGFTLLAALIWIAIQFGIKPLLKKIVSLDLL